MAILDYILVLIVIILVIVAITGKDEKLDSQLNLYCKENFGNLSKFDGDTKKCVKLRESLNIWR